MDSEEYGPGERRLRAALRRRRERARRVNPVPYDEDWGWWVERRLGRLESSMKWFAGLAGAALAAEAIRIALQTLGLAP